MTPLVGAGPCRAQSVHTLMPQMKAGMEPDLPCTKPIQERTACCQSSRGRRDSTRAASMDRATQPPSGLRGLPPKGVFASA